MNTPISAMTKILLALCLVLLSSVALAGCGGNDPHVDLQKLSEAVGHGDAAAAKDFKLTDKEAASVGTKFADTISKSISVEDGAPSKESLDALQKAMDDKLKELKFKAETVSKSENSAKVKITTDYIDYMAVLGATIQNFEAEMTKLGIDENDPKALDKVATAYLNLMAREITNAKVQGQQSFEVEVTKDKNKGKWMPTDLENFQETLSKYMLFKDGEDLILDDMR